MDISNPTFSLLSYSCNVKSSQQAALNTKHCHSSLLPLFTQMVPLSRLVLASVSD